MSILVTGGAGYIGSHTVKELRARGEQVIIYDDLSTGFYQAAQDCMLVVGSLHHYDKLVETMRAFDVDSVVHFAAYSQVGESMNDPGKYYYNNVAGTIKLLNAMKENNVKRIVFSSTAATFGEPDSVPISEETPQHPASVYGTTKLMIEKILRDYDAAYGIRSVALRYFNAAGADESGLIGEAHNPETHLIPLIMQVLLGRREHISIYGTDYPTPDGTCVRDYIHVTDLATAHILSLNALRDGMASTAYNLGNGNGFSVREVIGMVEKVTGRKVATVEGPRRSGDPAVLIDSSEKIMRELNWKPKFNELEQIIASAWRWHESHPYGY